MNEKAFTLIEILVVTAITMIVTGTVIAGYRRFNKKQILQTAAAELKNNLNLARGWAMAARKKFCVDNGKTLLGYKVEISARSETSAGFYEIYEVCNDNSSELVETFSFPDKLDNTGGTTILFQVLSGAADATTITLSLDTISEQEQISIKTNGQIE